MIDDSDIDSGLPEPPPHDGPGLFGGPPAAAPVMAAAAKPYRVLARAYRPTRFEDLIGQDAMVRILRRAFAINRVAHAFMLTGVRGVGKTTSARIIARALNCIGPDGTGGPTAEPCGVCANCTAILADRHPDVLEMDAASRTGIDDVREIIEATRFRPMQARMKVFIVDEVHMLSKPAFNALLKTLEEPPSQVTFIFATTELRKVPVTVLSRCQRFDLRRVSISELSAHFARIAAREGAAIGADALALISRAADGSVRDGLSLLDQAIAQGPSGGGSDIGAEQVADMLGLADRGLVFDLLDAVMEGRADVSLGITDQAHARGADLGQMLQDLLELIHTVSRLKSIPALRDSSELPEAERVRGAALADALSVPVLGRAWQMLLKGVAEIETAPDRREAAEMVLIRLCHVADLPTPGDLVRQIQAEGPGAVVAPMPPVLPGTSASRSIDAGQNARSSPTAAPVASSSLTDADAGQGTPLPASRHTAHPSSADAGQGRALSSSAARPPDLAAPSSASPDADAGRGSPESSAADPAPVSATSSSMAEADAGQGSPLSSAAARRSGRNAASSATDVDVGRSSPASSAADPAPGSVSSPSSADADSGQTEPSSATAPATAAAASARPGSATGQGAPLPPSATVAASDAEQHASPPLAAATPSPTHPTAVERPAPAAVRHAPSGAETVPPRAALPNRDAQEPPTSAGSIAPAAATTSPPHGALPASLPPVAASSTAAPPPDAPVQALSGGGALRAHADPASTAPVPLPPTSLAPTPSDLPPVAPSLRSWREVVAFVNASRMATLHGNLMHCAHLVRFRPPVIELSLESGAPPRLSQQLAAVLQGATGTRWSIVVVRDEPGEPTLAQQAGLVQADLDRDAESHPLVQAILAAFPGAVVGPVSDRSLDEYYALPPEQDGSLLAEETPPDMEFAPDNAESVGLDDLAAASGR